MAMTFDPIFAADPSNAANVASNASILIFNPADAGKAPIALTDVTGAALPNPITVNKNGFGPAFTSTLDRVAWSGGGFTGFFTSYEGIKAVATAAQAAAEAAAATAGTDAAAVATAAIGTATDDAAASAASASASATAAANAAALVGAPADAAITAAINSGASATNGALKSNFMPKWQPNTVYLANDKVLSPNGDVLSAKINFTSGATYNPANWDLPLNATYEHPRKLTMALLGDSITNQNSPNDYLVTDTADPLYPYNQTYNGMLWKNTNGAGFWTWANAYLGQRFTQTRPLTGPNNEFGMSGKTAAELVSEGHVANVIAAAPDWCHLMVGRNDAFQAASAATISTRVKTIVDMLVGAGIRVVLSTIIPGSTVNPTEHNVVRAANKLIKAWAVTTRGVVLNDWYMTLVDPTTGNGKSIYFADGTHPFGAGASKMGYALAKVLEPITPKSDLQITSDGLLGLPGAFQAGTAGTWAGANPAGGSGPLASGTSCYVAAGVTVIGSKVPRTDMIPGEWQQLQQTVNVAGGYNYTNRNSNVGTDWSVGDTVYGVVEYETDAAAWNANQLSLTLRALPNDMRVDAAGSTSDTALYQPVVAKGVLKTPTMVVPTGTTYLRLDVNLGGGTHTVRIGRMQIYKV